MKMSLPKPTDSAQSRPVFTIIELLVVIATMFLTTAGTALAVVHYVDVSSASPTSPYTNWITAATTIQQAVDTATAGDEIVVTNGTYAIGGRAVGTNLLSNRVAVDKPLTVRSINGPHFTVIQGFQVPGITNGDGAIRCVYLTNGASLSGFTLTNGATHALDASLTFNDSSGGGVWCESPMAIVSNCVMAGNAAYNYGGGAASGTLNNCTLSGNSASAGGGVGIPTEEFLRPSVLNNCALNGNSATTGGGAAYNCTLNNCTLTSNSASTGGGGAWDSTVNNCVAYFNTAEQWANCWGCIVNHSCTTPLPPDGNGNISLSPQLASSWHLSAGSPCRGAGSAAYVSGTDIDDVKCRLRANASSSGSSIKATSMSSVM